MLHSGKMVDDELRRELIALGYTPGPITDSTRRILQKKLVKLRSEAKIPRSSENARRSRRQEPSDDSDEESDYTRVTNTADQRRQPHGHFQTPEERLSRDTEERGRRVDNIRQEAASWRVASRVDESRYPGTSISSPVCTDDRWRRERAYLPGDDQDRSSLGYNKYSSDNLESSSLGYNRNSSDNLGSSSLGYNRNSSDNLGSSSLGYNRNSSDNLGSSSLGYNRNSSDNLGSGSLGYNRNSSDNLGSGSLGYNRNSSDNLGSSSLGSNRYSSLNPERSSLGYNRYSSLNPESTSFGSKYSSDNLESSSIRYNRNVSANPERSSLGFNRSVGDELRYRSTGDSSRDQSTSACRTVLDSLSFKTYPGLGLEKVSSLKPAWSKKLEYYLSRLLRLLCLILVLVFAGILIVKSGMLGTSQDNDRNPYDIDAFYSETLQCFKVKHVVKLSRAGGDESDAGSGVKFSPCPVKLLPSDCEGREDQFCKAKQKEITLRILSELYDFLSIEAGSFECGNPSGLNSKCIPIKKAKEHVLNVSGHAAEKFEVALDWMLSSGRHLGIWAKAENTEELVTAVEDVFCVESSRPRLGFVCRLKNALYTAVSNLFLALLGIFILWIILILLRYHWQRLEEEEKQMFAMVEKIIDVLKRHYKDCTLKREQNPYVGILHVRDSLIVPQDRKHLKKVWDRAVKFIEDNESRVRTEMHRIDGADLRVWRWTQTRNEHPR